MKFKTDFVTNSSSSSFIVAHNNHFTEEQIAKDDTETIQQTEAIVPSVEIISDDHLPAIR